VPWPCCWRVEGLMVRPCFLRHAIARDDGARPDTTKLAMHEHWRRSLREPGKDGRDRLGLREQEGIHRQIDISYAKGGGLILFGRRGGVCRAQVDDGPDAQLLQ